MLKPQDMIARRSLVMSEAKKKGRLKSTESNGLSLKGEKISPLTGVKCKQGVGFNRATNRAENHKR